MNNKFSKKINNFLKLNVLCCPKCKSDLVIDNDCLVCKKCMSKYIVKDDIIVFI